MPTDQVKIESNITELRIAEESAYKVLPGTPIWKPYEPNSYSAFGGSVKTVPRKPISADRQNRKGRVVGLEASAGFQNDFIPEYMQDLLQGFLLANLRRKAEITTGIVSVTASSDTYTVTSGGAAFRADDLVLASGFALAANRGLKKVVSSTATTIVVPNGTSDETAGASAKLVVVGHEFDAGDLQVLANVGEFSQLTSTAKDFTQLGLVPGEWIFIGGDSATLKFANAANNGYARVRSIAANVIVLDKTYSTMVTDTGAGKNVQLFFGRVLKNESGDNIVRRTYQLERKLGVPDSTQPSQVQSEYVVGAMPSTMEFDSPVESKITLQLDFVGGDHETRTGVQGVKSGTRPTQLTSSDALNTSSDVKRTKLAVVSSNVSNTTALFGYYTGLKISLNNNVTPNKAISVLGAFDVSYGNFDLSVDLTAYFADVSAPQAIRASSALTLDSHYAFNNSGFSFDIPVLTASDNTLSVDQDKPIEIPLKSDSSTGAYVDAALNHTLLLVFFDYLPTLAG